jgi:hypothetical protein
MMARVYHQPAGVMLLQAIACRDLDCLIWPFFRNRDGRGRVKRSGKYYGAHVLVCEAVNGPRPSPDHDASHLCRNGRGGCVNGSHIIWETKRENRLRNYKLTTDDVRAIHLALARGELQSQIAAQYAVDQSAISHIKRGRIWGWIDG